MLEREKELKTKSDIVCEKKLKNAIKMHLLRKILGPTFSAAGHGALEGAGDRLPGFLLSRSLFQRHRADQLTGGRGHLRSNKRQDLIHICDKKKNKSESVRAPDGINAKIGNQTSVHETFCEHVLLMLTHLRV